MSQVSVLIVDDSPTMRSIIKAVLRADTDVTVIGEAGDPFEARQKIKELNPDVVILDIQMPKMSGLEFLQKIMTLRPMPVIMLSGTTKEGAAETIEAMELGAFACLEKPKSGDYFTSLKELADIVKASKSFRPNIYKENPLGDGITPPEIYSPDKSIIAIGASTGGVDALMNVLSAFPANCPPTIITQHMPKSFLESFADRLNRNVIPNVAIASHNDVLKTGQIYIAPGGDTHLQIRGRNQFRCHLDYASPVNGHRPSVDVMFRSVAASAGDRGCGVILTGLGRDGAKGLKCMKDAGARTFGQDEESCVVYGMPKAAEEEGAVQKVKPLKFIGPQVIEACRRDSKQLLSAPT